MIPWAIQMMPNAFAVAMLQFCVVLLVVAFLMWLFGGW